MLLLLRLLLLLLNWHLDLDLNVLVLNLLLSLLLDVSWRLVRPLLLDWCLFLLLLSLLRDWFLLLLLLPGRAGLRVLLATHHGRREELLVRLDASGLGRSLGPLLCTSGGRGLPLVPAVGSVGRLGRWC